MAMPERVKGNSILRMLDSESNLWCISEVKDHPLMVLNKERHKDT